MTTAVLVTQRKNQFADVVPLFLFSVCIIISRYYSSCQSASKSQQPSFEDATQETSGSVIDGATSNDISHSPYTTLNRPYQEYCSFPSHIVRQLMKEERRIAKLPLLAMKSPMYDNCELLVST